MNVAVSKAQQKAVHKYVKNNYDRIELTVPKGRKDTIKAHAENHSESVNGFINRAIQETMSRDSGVPEAAGAPKGAGAVSLLPEAQEAAGEGLPVFVARAVTTQAERDKTARKLKGGKLNE